MVINVQRSGSTNLARSNPFNTLYIKGSEGVDGSIRLIFVEGDMVAHIEERADGVWNDTGFRFESSSVSLGRDFLLSAVGGFMETQNPSQIVDHLKALVPHIEFNNFGTLGAAHMPILDVRETFNVFAGPSTGEIIATSIGQIFTVDPTRILHSSSHIIGSVGATEEVVVSYYKGTDNNGLLLNRFTLPASAMGASMPLDIIYDSDFGFKTIENIFFEFVSTANISLEINAGGDVITSQDGHVLDEIDVILDEFTFSNELDLTLDNELNFCIPNRF